MKILSLSAPELMKSDQDAYFQYLEIVSQAFGYDGSYRYDQDFSLLVGGHNHFQCFGQWEQMNNGTWKCLATMAVIKRKIMLQGKVREVLCIGAVATHPNYRARGLFKKLMEYVFTQYQLSVEAFILWSDQVELYSQFGFLPCFDQYLISLDELCRASITEYRESFAKAKNLRIEVKPMNEVELSERKIIEKIFDESEFAIKLKTNNGFLRQPFDWSIAWQMPSVQIHLGHRQDGQLLAYALEGKGLDLQGVIHEWGISLQTDQSKGISSFEWLVFLSKNSRKKLRILLPVSSLASFVDQKKCSSSVLCKGDVSKNLLMKVSALDQSIELDDATVSLKNFYCSGLDSV